MAVRKSDAEPALETIEQLQQRYAQLNTKKIQAETSLKHARDQLATLKKEARDKFGTDDVAELRSKLQAMKSDNEQKRRDYQAELDRIENELGDVEERFAATPSADDAREER
jgi:hypothetical protein